MLSDNKSQDGRGSLAQMGGFAPEPGAADMTFVGSSCVSPVAVRRAVTYGFIITREASFLDHGTWLRGKV